jgi:hypothetical protein
LVSGQLLGLSAVYCLHGRACSRMVLQPLYSALNQHLLPSSVFLFGFQNGGPAGLVYGYLFCWIGTLATVASLAEMASMYRTPREISCIILINLLGCHFLVVSTTGFQFWPRQDGPSSSAI